MAMGRESGGSGLQAVLNIGSFQRRKALGMQSSKLFYIGAALAAFGLLITFTISWSIGLAIACLLGCGTMSVAALFNPGLFGQFNQRGGWYLRLMWITTVVAFGLIAVAPVVLVVGIVLFASE